jgi:aspartyl protease family protein
MLRAWFPAIAAVLMIGRVVFFVILGLAAVLLGPSLMLDRLPAPASAARTAADVATDPPARETGAREAYSYRETALRGDARGQFAADALVDGVRVHMLVDTGASDVVVSAGTAARLGLKPSGRGLRVIQTANGRTTAWPVRLYHLSFGGIYMNDVEALALPPEAGDVNLLGESFLQRLISVEQRDGMLILRQ